MGAFASVLYQDHLRRQARAETFKSIRDEAKLNKAYAQGNAIVAPNQCGPWIFIPFRTTACEGLLLSGSFKVEDETRRIGSDYLRGFDHVNAMIRRAYSLSTVTAMRDYSIDAIYRYCSGQLNPGLDRSATSIPDNIDELLRHLESKYRKELN